jgi:hypothetical protein
MMEERYRATTQNRFYPDMSNVNKNITVEAKLISPPTYMCECIHTQKIWTDVSSSVPHFLYKGILVSPIK